MYSKNKKILKSLCLSIFILFVLFIGYSNFYASTNNSIIRLAPNNDFHNINTYYQITDPFNGVDDIKLEDFFKQENSLNLLMKMNEDLNENFNFVEITFQFLQNIGYYTGDTRFTNTANGRANLTNQEVYINGEKTFVTPLYTMQINNNSIFKPLEDKIEFGRYFEEHDFIYDFQGPIPIILGNEYKNYYDLNDVIELNYLFMDFEFNVIGFFEKDTYITFKGTDILLDNYIVMPHFNVSSFPVNQEYESFLQKYYVQKNQGFIEVKELLVEGLSHKDKENIYNKYNNIVTSINKENNINYMLLNSNHTILVK